MKGNNLGGSTGSTSLRSPEPVPVSALPGDDPGRFTEADLRDAFRAGWQERNRSPGLKRRAKRTVHNAVMAAIGGGRHLDQEYVADTRNYHHSIWTNSSFRKERVK